jgi:hypothetical protein
MRNDGFFFHGNKFYDKGSAFLYLKVIDQIYIATMDDVCYIE